MSAVMQKTFGLICAVSTLAACAGQQKPPSMPTMPPAEAPPQEAKAPPGPPPREEPPPSGPAGDVEFPPRQTFTLDNGLTVDVVQQPALPIVQMQLVVQSGRAQDPEKLPGVAAMVAEMLTLGTKKRSAEKFAEAIEFLGADLNVWEEADAVRLSMRALSKHLDDALDLMADATLNPAFRPDELKKLRRRELGRLKLSQQEADYLARREFHRLIYGDHPYAHVDTTQAALKKLSRGDLIKWHRSYFAPNNAFLVVVGDVTVDQVKTAVEDTLGRWRKRTVKEKPYPEVPERTEKEIVVVDRPESVQSVIYIGGPGVRRTTEDYIPLTVANQVLGGSAASRLFMDLREKRSLTYGAYSRFDDQVDIGTFLASASVRNAVTGKAVGAFLEHIVRIVNEPVPQAELENAHRYLADSFPLKIETAGRVADLVADLRLYGLPADYWDTYRTRIREVDVEAAQEAAEAHIEAEKPLILVVGKAAEVVPMLRQYGPVRVIDPEGNEVTELEAEAKPGPDAKPKVKPGTEAKPKPGTEATPEAVTKPKPKPTPEPEVEAEAAPAE